LAQVIEAQVCVDLGRPRIIKKKTSEWADF